MFRNTELIYRNDIARMVEDMGYEAILTEGADHILGWRSPNYMYQPSSCTKLKLLLKNYRLSDDIAFRFPTAAGINGRSPPKSSPAGRTPSTEPAN